MMRVDQFRQLPRLLQSLTGVGLLLYIVTFFMFCVTLLRGIALRQEYFNGPEGSPPVDQVVALLQLVNVSFTLAMISRACAWPGHMFASLLRQPERLSLWLETPRTQALVALLIAIPALCSLALTPLLRSITGIMLPSLVALDVIGLFTLLGAYSWATRAMFR